MCGVALSVVVVVIVNELEMYLGNCEPWWRERAMMWLISLVVILASDRCLRWRLCQAGSFGFCDCMCVIWDWVMG